MKLRLFLLPSKTTKECAVIDLPKSTKQPELIRFRDKLFVIDMKNCYREVQPWDVPDDLPVEYS